MENQKKKTILVTGGAGFVGSNLIEELVKDPNNRVVSLDNYSTGLKENHIDGAEYIDGHTKDIEELLDFVPDFIFHLGEYARTSESFNEVDVVWDYNVRGTFSVLEYCRKNKVRLIYAGSSTKFGDGGEGRNQSPYAWTKAHNTELVVHYGEWFGLDYVITYFYNVFGPRERTGKHGTLIEIYKDLYRQGKPLGVVAPGDQKRNFTHVADIVNGLIKVSEVGSGDNYALGHEKKYTITEVADMFGVDVEILPERKGDRKESALDLSKTKKDLNWSAVRDLREYIEDFKKGLNG